MPRNFHGQADLMVDLEELDLTLSGADMLYLAAFLADDDTLMPKKETDRMFNEKSQKWPITRLIDRAINIHDGMKTIGACENNMPECPSIILKPS